MAAPFWILMYSLPQEFWDKYIFLGSGKDPRIFHQGIISHKIKKIHIICMHLCLHECGMGSSTP
jgi:hypothetical protein